MFQIKICGITSVEDALAACEAGADAVGINFAAASPRYVELQQATAISAAMMRGVCKVGVFVNSPLKDVLRAVDSVGLDFVQLHGDEPPQYLQQLFPLSVIKAFRLPDRTQPLATVASYLAECRRLGCLPRLVLLDAFSPSSYGGTGQRLNWQAVSQYPLESWYPPLVLAGGLNPVNVADAIVAVRPAAVDVASGVESAPGKKDPTLMAQFVAAAKLAFERLR